MATESRSFWKNFVFYVDPTTKYQRPTFYFIWLIGSIFMAIIILPLYIYFVIRRSRIPIKVANSINYTLLDFEKIYSGKKLEDWREISNVPSSHIDVKDEDIQGKHVAKVYRFLCHRFLNTSCSDMSSKTAQEATTKSTRSSKSAKSVSVSSISSDDDMLVLTLNVKL
uniref:Uncharacterized protein n=1 Tax=Onchocerca volvulus TaxID=6282 RepID=A0A8R1Y6Y5_ONCVO